MKDEPTISVELTEWELDTIFLALRDRIRLIDDDVAKNDHKDLAAKIATTLPTGDGS